MKVRNQVIGCLCALCCEILYGMSYIFTRQATENASGLALLGWRFFIAVIVMGALVAFHVVKVNLKGRSLKPLFAVAICSPCIYFIAETAGINNTTASESGVLLACIPVVSLIASAVILRKKPGKAQIAGVLVTLIGIIITVFAVSSSSSLSAIGYLSLLIAVLSYALYSVFVEKAASFSEAEITFSMLAAGASLFVVLALSEAAMNGNFAELVKLPFTNRNFLSAILYQGIGCSILAFFLSNAAIARIGVNRTSSFIGVATVVSIIAGALILDEPFTLQQAIGAAVIIAGVYIANSRKPS